MLFDLDGVLYQGDRALPGAVDAVRWFRDRGVPHLFVTNTTSRPRAAIRARLAGMGLEVAEEALWTPPLAALEWLRAHRLRRVALFVPEATAAELAGLEVLPSTAEQGAEAVVLGDLGEAWDFARLNRAFRLLMDAPRPYLLALGMTRYWRAEDGLRLDVAPFVVALQHATGVEPVVLGKPSAAFYAAALARMGADAGASYMVGDDIRGDVAGAQRAGLAGILVRTGKFRPADLAGEIRPDAVLDSVADLPAWWQRHAAPG